MAMPKITMGCDPELFVQRKSDGVFVSAHDLIPGTKDEPHKVPGGAIQVDGLAVEFNIDPASTLEQWNENINKVRAHLEERLPDYNLVIAPTCDFDPAYFASLPDAVKVLGCDPDFNAYTGKANPRPDGNPPFRTAAGHAHFGWTKDKPIDDVDHVADCIEVVKQLDFYLGLPSLAWDKDTRRRSMYGAAGCFRVKPYGVEYRTPSNMWLTHPDFQSFVYKAGMAAITDLHQGQAQRVYCGNDWAKNLVNKGRFDRDILGVLSRSNALMEAGLRQVYDLGAKLERQAKADKPVTGFKMDYVLHDEIGGVAMAPPPAQWGNNVGELLNAAPRPIRRAVLNGEEERVLDRFRWRGDRMVMLNLGQLRDARDFMQRQEPAPHVQVVIRAIGDRIDELEAQVNGAVAQRMAGG